ncbi:MAG: hypothetical protein ACRENM_07550 [Candidatus Dormibacteraceae bacterium]
MDPDRPERTDVADLPKSDLEHADDDHEVPEPPVAPDEKPQGRRTRRSKAKRSARPQAPSEALPKEDQTEGEAVTEREVSRAFYYSYRLFCRFIGAKPEASAVEFTQFGKAWIDLLKKVPGIKLIVTMLGPVVTMAELLDRFEAAWSKRTRFRDKPKGPRWGRRPADPSANDAPADPEFQVVDGGITGAP